MSGSYGSSNCHVYSACLHCVSDRKVYKQYLPVCSLLYKDRVRVLVCWFIVHYSWAHNFREILRRVSAVGIYHAAVTQFRVMLVIFSGWLFWSAFSFSLRFSASGMNLKAYSIASSILITFTLFQTIFVYFKLYKASRIKDHSHSQASQNSSYPNRPRSLGVAEAKATKTIIIITGSFFLCFAPTLCVSLVHQLAYVREDVILHVVYPLAESALFLTALVNPVIYVWRNALVKESLKELFKAH